MNRTLCESLIFRGPWVIKGTFPPGSKPGLSMLVLAPSGEARLADQHDKKATMQRRSCVPALPLNKSPAKTPKPDTPRPKSPTKEVAVMSEQKVVLPEKYDADAGFTRDGENRPAYWIFLEISENFLTISYIVFMNLFSAKKDS